MARRSVSAATAPPPTASAPLSSLFTTLSGLRGFPVQAPLRQEVHAVQDHPKQQQQCRQAENGDVAHGLVDQERRGDDGTEDGEHGRGPEVLVPYLVAPQHEDGDVDHHERYEEQHDRGAAQSAEGLVVATDGDEKEEGYDGGEDDGDPRRAAARVYSGERGGHHTLVSHAV